MPTGECTKAELRKTKAEKKTIGMIAKKANGKKNASATSYRKNLRHLQCEY